MIQNLRDKGRAYDNSAGTAMVMKLRALADLRTRRTMVFCLWSGEEGKEGRITGQSTT